MRSINESPYEYDMTNDTAFGNQFRQPPGARPAGRGTTGRSMQGNPVGYGPVNRNSLADNIRQHRQRNFDEMLTCRTPQPHDIPNNLLRRASDPVHLSTDIAGRLPFGQHRSAGGVFKRCQSVNAVRHVPLTTSRLDAVAAGRQRNPGMSCTSLMSSRSSIATDLDAISEFYVDENAIDRHLQEDAIIYGSEMTDVVLPTDETVDLFGGEACQFLQPNTCRSNMFVQPRRGSWAWNESDTLVKHPINFDLLDSDDGCKFNIESGVSYPGGHFGQHRFESNPSNQTNAVRYVKPVLPSVGQSRGIYRAYQGGGVSGGGVTSVQASNDGLTRQVGGISRTLGRDTVDLNKIGRAHV